MLRPRITPVLLVRNGGLVKTRKFSEDKYVGDPLNAVRIFNEKSVDEIIVIDIDATSKGKEPNYELIQKIANECRMPLCYGGGIKTAEQARRIISLGVEKVALSSAVLEDPSLCQAISSDIGQQSVVVVLDIKKKLLGKYEIMTHNAKRKHKGKVDAVISQLQQNGVGEFVINSIDNDGMQTGYDLELAAWLRSLIFTPLTILGGAGSLGDIATLISRFGVLGCGAGSLFVFKGKYRAVLINYPSFDTKYEMITASLGGV